jgi:hypothetical protein
MHSSPPTPDISGNDLSLKYVARTAKCRLSLLNFVQYQNFAQFCDYKFLASFNHSKCLLFLRVLKTAAQKPK